MFTVLSRNQEASKLRVMSVPFIFQKILWIGAVKFKQSDQSSYGASKLAFMLDELSQRDCDVTVVGHMACQAVMRTKSSASTLDLIENASTVWEFLKGRNLPGLVALDRVSCWIP